MAPWSAACQRYRLRASSARFSDGSSPARTAPRRLRGGIAVGAYTQARATKDVGLAVKEARALGALTDRPVLNLGDAAREIVEERKRWADPSPL